MDINQETKKVVPLTSGHVHNVLDGINEVKNYKVLCSMLGQPEKGGTAKRAQTQDWLRFFDYEKKGQKFIINEIYDSPLPRPARKSDVYASLIESTLAAMLARQPGYCCHLTKQQLYRELYMVNEHYGKWRNKSGSATTYSPVAFKSTVPVDDSYVLNAWEVDRFYCVAGLFLNGVLDRALRSLQNYRGMIKYHSHTIIVYMEDDVKQKRTATTPEEEIVLGVKQKVMHEMGLTTIPAIYLSGLGSKFFDSVNTILKEEYDWEYTYEEFEIIYNKEFMVKRLPEVQKNTKELIELFGVPLNKAIASGINSAVLTSKQRQNKKKSKKEQDEELYWGDPSHNSIMDVSKTEFIARQKLLTELMIRISPESYEQCYDTTVTLDTTNKTYFEKN